VFSHFLNLRELFVSPNPRETPRSHLSQPQTTGTNLAFIPKINKPYGKILKKERKWETTTLCHQINIVQMISNSFITKDKEHTVQVCGRYTKDPQDLKPKI
jgi:hypothetical protein